MAKFLLMIIGKGCALAPECLLRVLSIVLGRMLFWAYGSRRRMMIDNMRHAFPERDDAWARRIAKASCERLIETSLLSLAMPFLTPERIVRMAALAPAWMEFARNYKERPRPVLFGTAHMAYWEGLTWVPLLMKGESLPLVAVYRPLRQPALDEWIRQARERFGVRLLSRRAGLHAALHTLKRNGGVSILFDQNAGSNGVLTTFFGRDCSTTPLPGMLVERSGADAAVIYTRRSGFWRFTIELHWARHNGSAESVTLALNRELECALRSNDEVCASWLWLHNRWKILQLPKDLARLRSKRGDLTHLSNQEIETPDDK